MSELASWIGAVGALATAIIAVVLAAQLRNRDRRQALVDLHASLTSGETAAARNVLGTLLYSKKFGKKVDQLTAVTAYFQLIWALQRARNVFRLHGLHWASLQEPNESSRAKRARAAEKEGALSWNLREIAENVIEFHSNHSEKWKVEDADAWTEMEAFIIPDRQQETERK